jgi:hypothetical protein
MLGGPYSEEIRQLPKSAVLLAKVLAALLIGVLAWKWRLVQIAVTNPPWSLVGLMPLALVALIVVTAIGLIRLREWGFFAAYVLVPFSTAFHGIALVPWLTNALPTLRLRIWAVFVLNTMFLTAAIWVHRKYRGSERGERPTATPV